MASESTSPVSDFIRQARGMLAVNPMVVPQMEQFWKAQDGMLQEAEAFSKAWFERRHEATKSALDVVRAMNGNGTDPAATLTAMADWQQESFQRLAEDMQQWVEFCSNCTDRLAKAELEAGKEGAEETTKRTKSAAKQSKSTPV